MQPRPAPEAPALQPDRAQFMRRVALAAGVLIVASSLAIPEAANSEATPTRHCTTIRRRAQEIIIGTACTDNAVAKELSNPHYEKGWAYSVIAVGGIYKCGFVRRNTLASFTPRQGALQSCARYYTRVARQEYGVFKKLNCPDVLPGLQGCRDGTHASKVKPTCKKQELYGNYASDNRSAINIFGTGQGGFSQPRGVVKSVHFRAKVAAASEKGDGAAVIRSKDTGWGFVPFTCVNKSHLRGGPITKLSKQQKERIQHNPAARKKLRKIKQLQE